MRRIAQDIAALKQDMRVVKNRKPGLAYSSIEDGAIREYDKDGVLVSQRSLSDGLCKPLVTSVFQG
ncbi:hypothetical protein, partial [Glutamicibacter creatinolyticus]|uniref:hypothetical protein n=1 Tax=Glutamicibacter creatinolyticus TaxID=162496 RepID=UPI0032177E8F